MSGLDLDYELRLAVFDHVGRLAAPGGGVVRAGQLTEGIRFRGERIPIWNKAQGIFLPAILSKSTGAALTIFTAFDGPYDDQTADGEGRFVYRYQGNDPDNRYNVSLRRAGELGRPLLYLVGVGKGIYQPVFPCYVVADRPEALAIELVAGVPGSGLARPDENPLADLPLKEYVTRTVKTRLHQGRFREAVLGAYARRCAMCRLRHPELLEAAHIIPDRDPRGTPEVPNGLSLCRIHHGAFDTGILGVAPDYRIHLREDVLQEKDGPMLRHGLQELDGAAIGLPRSEPLRPNRDYLAERYERFRAA